MLSQTRTRQRRELEVLERRSVALAVDAGVKAIGVWA